MILYIGFLSRSLFSTTKSYAISRYFADGQHNPDEFDAIVTGDLGIEGGTILCELLAAEGLDIRSKYKDCGEMIYDVKTQDKHAGGSGCGCSAVVLASYLLPRLEQEKLRRIAFVGTGAMMSPSSIQQGLAIPAIAHLVVLCNEKYCY